MFQKGHKYWLGKKRSLETIEKVRKSRLGFKLSAESRLKISQALKGKIPKNLSSLHGKKTDEQKRKISNTLKGHKNFNTGRTWFKKGDERISGKNNHNWKGGINLENERLRHGLQWIVWRNEVYKRDNWTCRLCNKKLRKDIIAHHIKLFSQYPELRFSVENGMTLCRGCHAILHKPRLDRTQN